LCEIRRRAENAMDAELLSFVKKRPEMEKASR
jgi:hypothetical protein